MSVSQVRTAGSRLAVGIVLVLTWSALLSVAASVAEEPALRVERHAGSDRVTTAASMSRAFDHETASVYIVSATRFADALPAGPAAAQVDSPILLTSEHELPPATVDELVRLQPRHIFVVGGPAAISQAVVDQLRFYTPGSVIRLAGASRYDTAAVVSDAHFGPGWDGPVFVATGTDWADALAGGAVAAAHKAPLLLVRPDVLPDVVKAELVRLRPSRIIVVGGPASVSAAVRLELSYYTDGAVQWFYGDSRYDTAARISQTTFPRGTETVYLATGENYPDVLTGVPVAAREDAPILLLPAEGVPDRVSRELDRLAPQRLVLLGGHNAVSAAAEDELVELLSRDRSSDSPSD